MDKSYKKSGTPEERQPLLKEEAPKENFSLFSFKRDDKSGNDKSDVKTTKLKNNEDG